MDVAGDEGRNQGNTLAHALASGENPDADLFAAMDAEVADAPGAPRRPGRPKGSPNRTTLQFMAWARSRGYRDPAEFLLAMISRDARTIARDLLGKDLTDADIGTVETVFVEQGKAAAKMLPYVLQQLPHLAEHKIDTVRHLILVSDRAAVVPGVDIIEENQRIAVTFPEPSHERLSHASHQCIDKHDE